MHRTLILLILLAAVAVTAQPTIPVTISAEVVSELLPIQVSPATFAVPAIAMAKDRRGVAIAWTMQDSNGFDRISVARLDATAHIAGPIHSIPVTYSTPTEAVDPSLAVSLSGDGFTLAWMELPFIPLIDQRSGRVAYCQLDSDLNPSSPPGLPTDYGPVNSPPIVRSGRTTWLTAGNFLWPVRADGSLGNPLNASIAISDMTVATDFPQAVAGGRIRGPFVCNPIGHSSQGGVSPELCSGTFKYFFSLQFLSLYTFSGSKDYSFDSNAQAAINNDGHDVLMAWFRGAEGSGGDVVAARLELSRTQDFSQAAASAQVLGTYPFDSGSRRPDIVSDGERYVVVWRVIGPDRTYDIVGASIDRAGNIIPLSIATSISNEKDPSVIALGNGSFLVAYDKFDSLFDRRIAGRIVTFEPRFRAVR